MWKALSLWAGTKAPIVVVLTESMEPSFARGDILLLRTKPHPLEVGDILVYKLANKEIPIVHRVMSTYFDTKNSSYLYLTKGDNNMVDDRGIYADSTPGKLWIYPHEVMGIVYGYIPSLGYTTIVMNDHPVLKFIVIGALGLLTIYTRE